MGQAYVRPCLVRKGIIVLLMSSNAVVQRNTQMFASYLWTSKAALRPQRQPLHSSSAGAQERANR
jgi:hypothetical protein